METKKYTTHSSFWQYTVLSILWAIIPLLHIIEKSQVTIIIVFSLIVILYLVIAIQCRLAWHAYVEISEEGVKMKGCAKRISEHKKENVDDIFIPWENIEEIKGWIGDPLLVLKTGDKIKLTQQIYIDGRTLQKAFEQYKSKTEQTQEPFEVVGVYGQDSDSTSPNEFTDESAATCSPVSNQ